MTAPGRARQSGPGPRAGAGSGGKPARGGRPQAQPPGQPARADKGQRPGRQGRPGGAAPAGQPAPAPAERSGRVHRARQWVAGHPLQFSTFLLAVAGLGVSLYLTVVHYTDPGGLYCSDTGAVNCTKVTTSAQSEVFGIPVAVLGLAFYIFMAVANSPRGWRAAWPPLRWVRLGSAIIGMAFVLYLIYVELFLVDAICLWCTGVHVITFLLFGLLVYATAASEGGRGAGEGGRGAAARS